MLLLFPYIIWNNETPIIYTTIRANNTFRVFIKETTFMSRLHYQSNIVTYSTVNPASSHAKTSNTIQKWQKSSPTQQQALYQHALYRNSLSLITYLSRSWFSLRDIMYRGIKSTRIHIGINALSVIHALLLRPINT